MLSNSKMTNRSFELTRTWLVVAAAMTTLVGIVLLVLSAAYDGFWSAEVSTSWSAFWTQFLATIGAALIPIGVALIITEVILKPVFSRELLALAHLKQRVADIGFEEFGPSQRVGWTDLFNSSSSPKFYITHPESWLHANRDNVFNVARRGGSIEIYLASPTDPATDKLAEAIGIDPESYRAQILECTEKLRVSWVGITGMDPKARLEVLYTKSSPVGSIFVFDRATVFELHVSPQDQSQSRMYLRFGDTASSDVGQWVDSVWAGIKAGREPVEAWRSEKVDRSPAGTKQRLGTMEENKS